jgi:Xaa-Pro dipeptidase
LTDRYHPFRQVAKDLGVDAVALVPGCNFERLFRKSFSSHERPLVLLIPLQGTPAALVPNLEIRSFDLLQFEGEVFDWRDQTGYQGAFEALATHLPLRSIAVEGQVMRVFVHHAMVQAWPELKIIDAEKQISGLRLCKNTEEIEALEQAIQISQNALGDVIEKVRPGLTEVEVETQLVQALFAHGAKEQSFHPIVAAGENSARPHAHARADYQIQPGDALLIDFGARWGGLCADITRTFFVEHASEEAQEVYQTVLNANRAGHALASPKVTAHQVDDEVTSLLEASAYADRIRTKTGHGLGRAVHEDPYIMRGNHQRLDIGMVFTIEPGLYRVAPDGFGVRIEDDVLVTDISCRSLTTFPRSLTVIG